MSQDRREVLQARLTAAGADAAGAGSRMGALCELCVATLPVSGVGTTVLSETGPDDGDGHAPRRGLVHATDSVSAGLEELQLTVGEGPCRDAYSTGGPVLVNDLDTAATRWPVFTPAASDLGAAAVFSFPLVIGVIRLGSLDCYRTEPGGFSPEQTTDALLLAELAGHLLVEELAGHALGDVSWLADIHAEVHQASGMVQVQLDTSIEAALLRLRAHAFAHAIPLSEVARQVVNRRLRFAPQPPPDDSREPA